MLTGIVSGCSFGEGYSSFLAVSLRLRAPKIIVSMGSESEALEASKVVGI
jgi:hypothetical protein